MKKILSIALIIVILLGIMILLSGCKQEQKITVDEIIKYMSDKYGEEFTYIERAEKYKSTKYGLSIYVKSEKYPNKKIYAKCVFLDNNEGKGFSDNYDAIVYEQETREYFTNIVNKVYPNAKVRYIIDNNISTSYAGSNIKSVKEFISESPIVSFIVLLEPGHDIANKDFEINKLCDELKQEEIKCTFTVLYSDDQDRFNTFKVDEYEYIEYSDARADVKINENYDVLYIKWRINKKN